MFDFIDWKLIVYFILAAIVVLFLVELAGRYFIDDNRSIPFKKDIWKDRK